jgi:hypothetical protein
MKNIFLSIASLLQVSSTVLDSLSVTAFNVIQTKIPSNSLIQKSSSTALSMAKQDEDLLRFARQSRSAGSDDNVVELMRPLGLVLNQDENGNVYVETVAPKGNAARTGKVRNMTLLLMPVAMVSMMLRLILSVKGSCLLFFFFGSLLHCMGYFLCSLLFLG